MNKIFQITKDAGYTLAGMSDELRNTVLNRVADAIVANASMLLEANGKDLERMEQSNPLYDRLQLTQSRLENIATDMRNVARLESPLGKITNAHTLENGLFLRRISVPFGVIGVIYEARPNVSFDVFSLCFKSGNACILKGGKDAENSNLAIISLIKQVLADEGVNLMLSICCLSPMRLRRRCSTLWDISTFAYHVAESNSLSLSVTMRVFR